MSLDNTPTDLARASCAILPRPALWQSALIAAVIAVSSPAQWFNLNPGGGGQIQDLVLDPNIEGRAFHLSDMEGLYRTDDHGVSWQFIGKETISSNCLEVSIEPGNSNRVYLGTLHGLQISDNAGNNWSPRVPTVTPDTSTMVGEPIQTITIDPSNVNRVFAGPGGTFRWTTTQPPTLNGNYIVSGEPSIYRTTDHGANWSEIVLAAGVNIRREIFNIAVDPTDSNIVYAANRGGGVYRSTNGGTTWTALARPSAAIAGSAPGGTGQCWGLALSPDGNILYASYTVGTNASLSPSDGTNLFATPTASINWTRLNGTGFPSTLYPFWKPVLDPRSTATNHKLLISQCSGARIGLYEVSINWDAGQTAVTSHSWELVGDKVNNPLGNYPGTQPYDPGWENYLARALQYSYTPTSWSYRGIWTTQDQTSYWVNTSWSNWQDAWQLLYCAQADTFNGIRTYINLGFHSTYNWDVASDGNYMLTGNADNATVESYDSGFSWTIQGSVGGSRTNAVAVALTSPRVALTHRGTGFGAGSNDGALYAKRLSTRLPANGATGDQWRLIAGGSGSVAGLGNYKITTITPDPFTPERVYFVVTTTVTGQQGVWVLNDVDASIDAVAAGQNPPNVTRILAADIGEGSDRKILHDPYQAGVIWVNHSSGLHRGVRQTNGTYAWTAIVASGVNGFTIWGWNGNTYIARYSNNGDLLLSSNAGASWSTVLTSAQAVGASGIVNPVWYQRNPVNVQDIRGLTGYGDTLICAYGTWNGPRRHAGVFRGTISSGTNITWSDWTGDLPFGYFSRGLVADVDGAPWFIGATQGAGVWGRPITGTTYTLTTNATNGGVARSPNAASYAPGTVVQLTATPNSGYNFSSWSGDLTGSTNPANITMSANRTVTANFVAASYALTTNATNGTITRSPNAASYTSGTVVQLTATPSSGYAFSGWSGDLTGSTNPANITMSADRTVTANFVPLYALTTNATNGTITRSPNAASYTSGTVVQLTATPSSGYTFSGWSGDLTGSTNPANITMSANRTVTANFVVSQPAHIAENYSYSNGVNLESQGSATGNWTSGWTRASGTASATVNSPGLTYSTLAVAGNRMVKSVTGSTANLIYSRTFGNATNLFQNGDTVWFSAVVRKTNSTGGIYVLFNNGANQAQGFGFHLTSGSIAPRVSGVNGGTLTLAENTTGLIVGRLIINSSGNENLTIWVNPDMANAPTSGGVTLSTQNYDTVPTTLRLVTDNQNSTYELDEIRLGETFASIVPQQ